MKMYNLSIFLNFHQSQFDTIRFFVVILLSVPRTPNNFYKLFQSVHTFSFSLTDLENHLPSLPSLVEKL